MLGLTRLLVVSAAEWFVQVQLSWSWTWPQRVMVLLQQIFSVPAIVL